MPPQNKATVNNAVAASTIRNFVTDILITPAARNIGVLIESPSLMKGKVLSSNFQEKEVKRQSYFLAFFSITNGGFP
jgi:hypothetical protein